MASGAPILSPSGGVGATAAITLTNGADFDVTSNGSLTLTGPSTGGAIFVDGDGTAGEVLKSFGPVTYNGASGQTDYIKVPVLNNTGPFTVNAGTLQVPGTDSNTKRVLLPSKLCQRRDRH